jgi:isoamylase
VLALRARQQRNLLATLLLSQGVPMVLSGDEVGRTQGGNNNAYCQDNAISWFDWARRDEDLLAFTTGLIALRRDHPVFHRRRWFQGRPLRGTADIVWVKPDGTEMTEADWNEHHETCVGMFLNGEAIPSPGPRGGHVVDRSFLLLINASSEPRKWTISGPWGESWCTVLDTATYDPPTEEGEEVGGDILVTERSLVLLRRLDPA